MKDVIHVYLTGGEPFLSDKLVPVCEIIKKRLDATISLTTNGLLPDKVLEYSKQIKDLGLDILSFDLSINGPREIHDYTRGIIGGYDKLMETRDILEKLDIPHNWIFTILKSNAAYVEWFMNFHRDLRESKYFAFGSSTEILGNPDSSVFVSEFGDLLEIDDDSGRDLQEYLAFRMCGERYFESCAMGTHQIRVMPNGEAYICDAKPVFRIPIWLSLMDIDSFLGIVNKIKTSHCRDHCSLEYCIYRYNKIIYSKRNLVLWKPFYRLIRRFCH